MECARWIRSQWEVQKASESGVLPHGLPAADPRRPPSRSGRTDATGPSSDASAVPGRQRRQSLPAGPAAAGARSRTAQRRPTGAHHRRQCQRRAGNPGRSSGIGECSCCYGSSSSTTSADSIQYRPDDCRIGDSAAATAPSTPIGVDVGGHGHCCRCHWTFLYVAIPVQ